jgi:hypothetical protein
MAVKILRVKFRGKWKQEPDLMIAVADFGDGKEREIPLPAHFLPDDDYATRDAQAAQGMENLAKALLEYADRIRSK